jgi:hypothetical protein
MYGVQYRARLCLADKQVQNEHAEREDVEGVWRPAEIHSWAYAICTIAYFPRQPIIAPPFLLSGTTPAECLNSGIGILLLPILTTYHDTQVKHL